MAWWSLWFCLMFVDCLATESGPGNSIHTYLVAGNSSVILGINQPTGCSEESCLKCGPKGCIKCPKMIVFPSRRCVDSCPFGHQPQWSTVVDYMGLVCLHNGNFMGLSNNSLAVLAGISSGIALCLILMLLATIYIKYKRKNFLSNDLSESGSELDDSPERRDFLKQLETLRPFAQNYLDMLNDTRRQLRQLHQEGDNSSAYKPVVRDLAKILLLLNRPSSRQTVPEDWDHLFSWAEKALKRYKRLSQASQHQVAQLINFLQDPGEVRSSITMTTFKPMQDVTIDNFQTNYDSKISSGLNPQWKFEYSLVNNSEFNPALWRQNSLNGSTLFLEDDFGQLGFRPQDEITTEL